MAGALIYWLRPRLLAGALAALAGCGMAGLSGSYDPGTAATDTGDPARSAESQALTRFYGRVAQGLKVRGLLRDDGGGPDTPFSASDLVNNFMRIAMFKEYTIVNDRVSALPSPVPLQKWERPIRMSLVFGDTVPADQKAKDRADVTAYTARLSRLTALPIQISAANPNFHVFVVNEDERRGLGPDILAIIPRIHPATIAAVRNMPRSDYCLVFAIDEGETASFTNAVAIIRAELPDILRLSCIQEELAQGLGLSNDSAAARPSLFNDNKEFGLLTTHDEMLLRILYDPRMRTGMDATTVRRVAEIIAAELVGRRAN